MMHPSHLPSNTLIVTLSPPGKMFYLPSPLASRAHSPNNTTGYASDPESELRKVKQSGKPLSERASDLADPGSNVVSLSRRRHKARTTDESNPSNDILKTAGWQDLFKYVAYSCRRCSIYSPISLGSSLYRLAFLIMKVLLRTLYEESTKSSTTMSRLP